MPSIALPVSLRGQLLSGIRSAVPAFSPADLFSTGSQGIWLDPSDLSTMFSDRAGTTPVTAPGTVVGLRLDKSKGLTLGADLFAGGFVLSTSTTAKNGASDGSVSVSGGVVTIVRNSTDAFLYPSASNYSATSNYELRFTVVSGSVTILTTFATLGPGTYRYICRAGTGFPLLWPNANSTAVLSSVSVRELAGNHAVAPTDAARPTYGVEPKGGRRNLLTYSEQFNDAAWAKTRSSITVNAGVAPDGTTTTDKLVEDTSTTNSHILIFATGTSASKTLSIYAKAGERSFLYLETDTSNTATFFNLSTGAVGTTGSSVTAAISDAGNGWYRCSISGTFAGSGYIGPAAVNGIKAYTGDGTSGIYIWGAQLELGSTATPYQRVTTAYDVTESGVPTCHYVQYDGSDDSMSTAAIDFTATDKMSVFVGVRKLSDAATGALMELGSGSDNGAFLVHAPNTLFSLQYRWSLRNNAGATTEIGPSTGYAAPINNVLTGIADISGDRSTIRLNGTQFAQSTADQGAGNFANLALNIGRRAGGSLPFNGRDYGIIVVGKAASAGEITDTELWLSDRTAEVDVAKSISPNIYTRSGDTILDRANSIIERRA